MPNFKKSSGFKMRGYTYPGTSPLQQDKFSRTEKKLKKTKTNMEYIGDIDTTGNFPPVILPNADTTQIKQEHITLLNKSNKKKEKEVLDAKYL